MRQGKKKRGTKSKGPLVEFFIELSFGGYIIEDIHSLLKVRPQKIGKLRSNLGGGMGFLRARKPTENLPNYVGVRCFPGFP